MGLLISDLPLVSGEHEFVPPNFAAGDVRGPCPGLNALANHGYLPRNGVAGVCGPAPLVGRVLTENRVTDAGRYRCNQYR